MEKHTKLKGPIETSIQDIFNQDNDMPMQSWITLWKRMRERLFSTSKRVTEPEILELVHTQVRQIMPVDNLVIILREKLTGELRCALVCENNHRKNPENQQAHEKLFQKINKPLIEEIIQTGESRLFTTQEQAQPVFKQTDISEIPATWMGVPMRIRDLAIGAFVAYHPTQEHFYTEEQRDILDAMSDQAAIAIDNVRLADRFAALSEIERRLTLGIRSGEKNMLVSIYEEAQKVVDTRNFFVILHDKFRNRLHYALAVQEGQQIDVENENERKRLNAETPKEIVREILQEGTKKDYQKLLVSKHEVEQGFPQKMPFEKLPACWLGVPMRLQERVIGAFIIYHPTQEDAYNQDDAEILDAISDQAALALDTARLLQRREILTKIKDEISSLKELTEAKVFDVVAKRAVEISDLYNLCIFLYDEDSDSLNLRLAYRKQKKVDHLPERRQEILDKMPQHLLHKIIKEQQPELLHTRKEVEFAFKKATQGRIPATWLGVPMRLRDKTIGVFAIFHMAVEEVYDEDDVKILDNLSDQTAIALDNARLFEAEREQRKRAEVLQTVGRIVNSPFDSKEVSKLVLEQLQKVIAYDSASIQIFHGEQRKLWAYQGLPTNNFDQKLLRKISEDTLIRKIIGQERPEVISDTAKAGKDEWEPREATSHVSSWIGAPLIAQTQVIGLLTIDHATPGFYTDAHAEIAAAFADQIASALQNSERSKALAELSEISNRLLSIQELSDTRNLLEKIAKSARKVLKADVIELYEYHQKQEHYTLPPISIGERNRTTVPQKIYEDDAVFKLIHRTEPLYAKDSEIDAILSSPYTAIPEKRPIERFAAREDIRSTAAIPLRTGDESMGLMFANYRTTQSFTKEQRKLIELFAHQAAIAIQNARLYNESELSKADLKKRTKQQKILIDLGQKLTSTISLTEKNIWELIHKNAKELMDVDNMYIALHDHSTRFIRFGMVYENGEKIDIDNHPLYQPRRDGSGKTEDIIRTGKPLFHRTPQEAQEYYEAQGHTDYINLPQEKRPASWIGVPMKKGNRVLGVIATYPTAKDYIYSDDDVEILQSMANLAAIALENTRLYNNVYRSQNGLIQTAQRLTSDIQLQKSKILNVIHQNATRLLDAENMYVALYDEQADSVSFPLIFREGQSIKVAPREQVHSREKIGRTEVIIRNKESLFHPTEAENRAWYQEPGHEDFVSGEMWLSWIGVPMCKGDKVLGVIAAYNMSKENAYSQTDLDILQTLANLAAIALENARLYSEKERQTKKLQELNSRLEEANYQIAEKQDMLTRSMIAADFVHRLNNLAGTVPIWVDMIRNTMTQKSIQLPELNVYLENIIKDNDGLLRAAEQLKAPRHKVDIDVVFMLQAMLRQVRIQHAQELENGQLRMETSIAKDLYKVRGIMTSLAGAIYGVISNGIDSMLPDQSGKLIVKANNYIDTTEWIRLEIEDTGKGIRQDEICQIFSPSFTTKGSGRGYGLWSTKVTIENMDGKVIVASEEGKGTKFTILLPKTSKEE